MTVSVYLAIKNTSKLYESILIIFFFLNVDEKKTDDYILVTWQILEGL